MIHGLNNSYLYAAKKITVTIEKGKNSIQFMGTGFFLLKDNDLILVTNRHVVQPWYSHNEYNGYSITKFEIESYQKYDDDGIPIDFKCTSISNYDEFMFSNNIYDDVACLINPKGGEFIISSHIPYDYLADKEWINNKLCVCDSIAYPGFPMFYDKINNSPIFRMGTIASDPRFDYSGSEDGKSSDRIAYEGFSSGGSSGSPVFATQRGYRLGSGLVDEGNGFYRESKLIGINAGHYSDYNPIIINGNTESSISSKQHSGISYFYKSTIIRKIIEDNSN